MIKNLQSRVGNRNFPVIELPTDTETFRLVTGREIMPSFGYLVNDHTVAFARSPDNENPATIYLAKKDRKILRGLNLDGYSYAGRMNNGGTLLLELKGDA